MSSGSLRKTTLIAPYGWEDERFFPSSTGITRLQEQPGWPRLGRRRRIPKHPFDRVKEHHSTLFHDPLPPSAPLANHKRRMYQDHEADCRTAVVALMAALCLRHRLRAVARCKRQVAGEGV